MSKGRLVHDCGNAQQLYSKDVKRVVLTGSIVSMGDYTALRSLTEEEWNDGAVDMVQDQGAKAPPVVKYVASKVLAERAIVDFVEKNKGEIGWDATRILPAWVRHASIQYPEKRLGGILWCLPMRSADLRCKDSIGSM